MNARASHEPLLVQMTAADLRALIAEAVAESVADRVEQPPALINQSQLARELGVSVRTIHTLREQGLPVVWVCESPRFELATCLDWLRARKQVQP